MPSVVEIVQKLHQAEELLSNGSLIADLCLKLGIADSTYYKWRREYGGLTMDEAKRLEVLQRENSRLNRAVTELTLDKRILEYVTSEEF